MLVTYNHLKKIKTMADKLTVKEALEQGYTSCTPMYEEFQHIDIKECDFTHKHGYEIIAKETKPYQIHDSVVQQGVYDYLENQEDVENDYGNLEKLVAEVDFTAITNEINKALSVTKYFFGTDIQLIP